MSLQLDQLPPRVDLVDGVYRVLRDAITDGSLEPGERITQEEIAEKLSVSRSPVLQALRLLKKDGFIQDAPGRGVQVAPLDPDRIGQLYEVRGALDALAARLAAQKRYAIDPAVIEAGRRTTTGDDIKAMIDADLAFHNAIYEASGNAMIAESAHHHWAHLRRVMGAVHRAYGLRSTIWDEHQAIADAIAQGDAERAVLLTELHIRRARKNVLEHLSDGLPHEAPATA